MISLHCLVCTCVCVMKCVVQFLYTQANQKTYQVVWWCGICEFEVAFILIQYSHIQSPQRNQLECFYKL